jgi:hypothetical protein
MYIITEIIRVLPFFMISHFKIAKKEPVRILQISKNIAKIYMKLQNVLDKATQSEFIPIKIFFEFDILSACIPSLIFYFPALTNNIGYFHNKIFNSH